MASSPENSPSQDTPPSPPASSDSSSDSPPPPDDNSGSSSYSPPPPDDSNSSSSNSSSSNDNSHSDSSYPPPDDSSQNSQGQGQGQGQESTPSQPDDSSNSNSGQGQGQESDSPPAPRTNGNNNRGGGSSSTPVPPNRGNSNSNGTNKPLSPSHGGSSNDNSSSQSAPSNSTKESSDSSNNRAVIGVAAGAALLLVVAILLIALCCRKKKKKKKLQQQNRYYDYGAPNSKGDHQYYMGQQQAHWQSGYSPDGMLKPPMPHSGIAGSPAVGWGAQPHMSGASGEMSSNFSGPHRAPMPPPSPALALGFSKSTFSYEELAAATNGFSNANLLGQGGFGYVHKGVLPNGKEVAVKSLKSGSGQGEREFQAEVEIISRVHHRHLVSLVGYCIAGGQRMLVYEFVPNNTLEYHLHGKQLAVMDFQTRMRIALGSAKGLAYLHEDCHPKIIHRDIKAANILIENDFEAKVADFGLAKLSSDNFTHVSTRVMGTFGYLAPEYASSGKLTEKSDVFSFGVMLLELATGKQPVDHTNAMDEGLVDWARPLLSQCLEEGNFDLVADPMLERNYNPQEMACLVGCAAAAIRHSAKKRPRMSQIVRALEGESSLDDLNEGVKPGQSTVFGPGGGTEYTKSSYNADMQRFRQLALASGEVNSSDYSSNDSRDITPRHENK